MKHCYKSKLKPEHRRQPGEQRQQTQHAAISVDACFLLHTCRFEKMALMLLHERQKGKSSVVSGYIEQLPAEFDTLLHWSSEELQLLMYPPLIQQVLVHGDWQ